MNGVCAKMTNRPPTAIKLSMRVLISDSLGNISVACGLFCLFDGEAHGLGWGQHTIMRLLQRTNLLEQAQGSPPPAVETSAVLEGVPARAVVEPDDASALDPLENQPPG